MRAFNLARESVLGLKRALQHAIHHMQERLQLRQGWYLQVVSSSTVCMRRSLAPFLLDPGQRLASLYTTSSRIQTREGEILVRRSEPQEWCADKQITPRPARPYITSSDSVDRHKFSFQTLHIDLPLTHLSSASPFDCHPKVLLRRQH